MSLKGRWRIAEMDAWDKDLLDLVEPACILFGETGSEFAFDWDGADEMDGAQGDGWAELQADGSLVDKITFHNGDDSGFTARRRETSSTAC